MKRIVLVLLLLSIVTGGYFLVIKDHKSPNSYLIERLEQQGDEPQIPESGGYIVYSEEALQKSLRNDDTTILFFHASWCPTCRAAEKDILENLDQIPKGTTILKTDYDTQLQLKKKYGVVTQHTFVSLDKNGQAIDLWNGGSLDEVLDMI